MNAYEKNLLNGIPQDEAASYFLRVTGRDKTASADLEEAWNELSPSEQDEILKEAMEQGLIPKEAAAPMGPPPAPASMPAPSPINLSPTAQGQNSVKMAKEKMTKEEKRLDQLQKNKHYMPSAHGVGGAVGGALGGALNAPKGKRLRAAGKLGLLSGAVGAGVSYAGEKLERNHLRKEIANKVLKEKTKKADDASITSGGTDPDGDPTLEEYLRQEAMGGEAEEQAGASFYRQRLQQAMQELEATKAQAEQTAAQAEQLQQQVAQNDETIQASMQQAQMAQQSAMSNVQQAHQMAMDATNQAMESQADALRQKQLAAAMRMGVQTLKDNVMNAMAQDPTDQLAQQLQAPPPGSAGMVGGQPPPPPAPIDPMTGQPMADPAMAGQDPNAAAGGAPASAGSEGGEEKKPSSSEGGEKKEKSESKSEKKDGDKKDDGGKTHVEVKTGSAEARFLSALKGLK